jgi:U6 snRNA-associated Sm-like protein LSm7
MADRGGYRGRGGPRGGGGRGGGGRGGGASAASAQGGSGGQAERPKKENILDLKKYMDQRITVKFNGGREGEWSIPHGHLEPGTVANYRWWWIVTGVLKGYDALMNLVLDEVEEALRGMISRSVCLLLGWRG